MAETDNKKGASMKVLLTLLVIIGVVAVWLVIIYNRLVKLRNLCMEGWSGIDVQLKRRANLIPNLLETVKGYMSHEKDVFREVTEARAKALSAGSVAERGQGESMLTASLRSLFAIAENYPELKANENFQDLQRQLSEIEDQIQKARRYYNATVRDFNTATEVFPNLIVASLFQFKKKDFFELTDPREREVPKVDFGS